MEYLLVSFPNGAEGTSPTMRALERTITPEGEVYHFETPNLRVGTLEKLMSSGDHLSKVDSSVEGVVRRIERAFGEVNASQEDLTVEGEPVLQYLQNFRWASAKYQSTRPIEELVKVIAQGVQKIDDELKEAMSAYQESKHELNALSRKKGGNLMANVGEYLQNVDPKVFVDTEFLTTVLVVVSKNADRQFWDTYESLASDAVGYGPADDRQSVLGSPVVPRSAQKIAEDKDGFCLYTVTVLKNFKDVFIQAAQKARLAVRDIPVKYQTESILANALGGGGGGGARKKEIVANPTDEDEESVETKYAAAEIRLNEDRNQLRRWAQTNYGEAFIAWIHIKAVRLFVEAVLVYGLPVDFVACLIKAKGKSDKRVRDRLSKLYASITGEDEESGDATVAAPGGAQGGQRETYYPYVSFTFKPFASE